MVRPKPDQLDPALLPTYNTLIISFAALKMQGRDTLGGHRGRGMLLKLMIKLKGGPSLSLRLKTSD